AALIVGGDRHGSDDAVDLLGAETLLREPLAGAVLDQALRAGAGGHALCLDSDQRAGPAVGCDRGAEEGVELLGGESGDGGRDSLGVAGRDAHLGSQAALSLADSLRNVGGQALGAEDLAEDNGVDGLVDDLLEAGHVDAGLLRVEVDEAFEVGVVEGGVVVRRGCLAGADADDLLDAGDADAREADPGLGRGGLRVAGWDQLCGIGHVLQVCLYPDLCSRKLPENLVDFLRHSLIYLPRALARFSYRGEARPSGKEPGGRRAGGVDSPGRYGRRSSLRGERRAAWTDCGGGGTGVSDIRGDRDDPRRGGGDQGAGHGASQPFGGAGDRRDRRERRHGLQGEQAG